MRPLEPRSLVRSVVRHCWAEILEVPEETVTSSTNFFSDGGDSLLAMELIAATGEAMGIVVPPEALFLDGDFEAFVEAVAKLANTKDKA